MNKYISEIVYFVKYTRGKIPNITESRDYFIADSIEEAIEMCKDKNNTYSEITVIEAGIYLNKVYRKSTKTITVNV